MEANSKNRPERNKRGTRAEKAKKIIYEKNADKKPGTSKERLRGKAQNMNGMGAKTRARKLPALQEPEGENARLREALEKESRERKLMEEVLRRNEHVSRELAETALRQAQELALLDKVRATIAAKLDMPALLQSVVESIAEVYGYTHVSVYMLEGSELILQHQVGYKKVIERIGVNQGISGKVVRTGLPILIEDAREHLDFLEASENLTSEITVPLMDNSLVAGTLSVESVNRLTASDLKILVALSADVGVAIGRARLYENIQQRNRTLSALQESTLAIMSQLGLQEALQAILAQAAQLIDTSNGYIYLLQADGALQMATGIGIYPKYIGMKIKPGEGLAGRVWQSAQPLNVTDYQHWEGRSTQFEGTPFHSVAGAPLMRKSRVAGVLGLAHLTPERTFSVEDVEFLSRFAQLASIALENADLYTQAYEELRERKQAEEALRDSRSQLESVFNSTMDGIVTIDDNQRIVFFNPAAEIIFRCPASKALGQPLDQFIPEDTRGKHLGLVHNFGKSGKTQRSMKGSTLAFTCLRADGETFPADISISQIEVGGRRLFTAFIRDITERKQAEEEALRRAGEFAALYDTACDLAAHHELPSLLHAIGERARVLLGAPASGIYLYDPERGDLEMSLSIGMPMPVGVRLQMGEGMAGIVAQTRQPLIVDDYAAWEGRSPQYKGYPIKAIVQVPMLYAGQLTGVLAVDEDPASERKFDQKDARILTLMAEYAAGAIHSTRLYEQAQQEIAERKQAEEGLRQSEQNYRDLLEQASDGFFIANPDGQYTLVNEAACRLVGYSKEELLSMNLRDLAAPEDLQRQPLRLDKLRPEQSLLVERNLVHKDGRRIPCEISAKQLPDGRFQSFVRDITERKQAEAERQEQLDELQMNYRFSESLARSESLEQTFDAALDALLALLRADRASILLFDAAGVMRFTAWRGLSEDYRKAVDGHSPWTQDAKDPQPILVEEIEHEPSLENFGAVFKKEGLKALGFIPLVQGGRLLGKFMIYFDTPHRFAEDEVRSAKTIAAHIGFAIERKRAEEALRESEERYRQLVENSPIGIYRTTPDGRILASNPTLVGMLGFSSFEELATRNLEQQPDSMYSRRAFKEQLEREGRITGLETKWRKRDGTPIFVREHAQAVRDESGAVVAYDGTVEDITERKRNEELIQAQLDQLNALHIIENAINSSSDLRATLEVILREVAIQLKVNAACALIFNKDTFTLDYTAGRGFLSKAMQHTKLSVGEGYAGRVILDRKTIHVPDLSHADNNQLIEALNLAGEDFAAYIGSPLIAKGQVVGVLEIFHRSPLSPSPEWFDFLTLLADQAALAIDNIQLFENLQRTNFDLTLAYDATIEGWSRALDLRDRETEGHTQRVTSLTVKLAQQMGIPDADILHIRRGTLLHDIGKMGVPDRILHKPDKLTPQEWDIMHQHTNYAYRMLAPITYLKPALDIPRFHHEKWDGSGYPDSLKGEQIPLAARIFAVVDVWDAVTSKRPYREAWTKKDAIEYIRVESGKHFDPKVVETFLSFIINDAP